MVEIHIDFCRIQSVKSGLIAMVYFEFANYSLLDPIFNLLYSNTDSFFYGIMTFIFFISHLIAHTTASDVAS